MMEHPVTYLVTGILFAASLSILTTGWIAGAIDTFTGFTPIVFTFFFVVIGCTTLNRIVILSYVLCAVALFISAQGMIAEFTGDFTSLYLLNEPVNGVPMYRHRGLGVIADPNDLSEILVIVLPLMWLRPRKGQPLQQFFLTFLPAVGLAVGIYYTHSRGGALALIAVVLFGLKDAIGVIGSSILTGLFTLGVLALNISGGRAMNEDDGERISLWSQALTAFKSHPLFGVGVGHFAELSDIGLTAHNSYLLCLAELGIVGYFFWIGSIVVSWTGLSQIVQTEKAANHKEVSADTLPAHLQRDEEQRVDGPVLAARDEPLPAYAMAGSTSAVQPELFRGHFGPGILDQAETERESLAHSAKAVRTSLVGLLVSVFFISRTYSIILYVLLGIATSLQLLSWKQQGLHAPMVMSPLVKKICYIMASSVLFLYLFVRLHGSS